MESFVRLSVAWLLLRARRENRSSVRLRRGCFTVVDFAGHAVGGLMSFPLWQCSIQFCVCEVAGEPR